MPPSTAQCSSKRAGQTKISLLEVTQSLLSGLGNQKSVCLKQRSRFEAGWAEKNQINIFTLLKHFVLHLHHGEKIYPRIYAADLGRKK